MDNLAKCLRYYVADRLNNDPGWKNLTVILSDASAPGEGEHKIMDYIRRQRAQPNHDPNTHHCLCGADADLIMLGLATHEPNFTIIREEFKPNKPKPCGLCNQFGHEVKECQGLPKEKQGEHDQFADSPLGLEQEFIFIRLSVLKEYLEKELTMASLPFTFDVERSIDDWVFMCFFVGNDFLPHLPSLEIREGAIDRLVNIYKNVVHKTGGYLTENGFVNLQRVQMIMLAVGEVEDSIFKKRKDDEENFKRRQKEKRKRMKREQHSMAGGQFTPQPLGRGNRSSHQPISNPRQTAFEMRMQDRQNTTPSSSPNTSFTSNDTPGGIKRKAEDSDSEPEPEDNIRLWEAGWKQRYYKNKFDVDVSDKKFRRKVVQSYVEGLCWVLRYYYQGCASWKWYYPFHYAPFASDFEAIADMPSDFEKGTKPFKPLEQLMGVFPAASGNFLPLSWRKLMTDPESSIIDFYPEDFAIDLNGKKYAWQGVALLPFVDERRLRAALAEVYPDLTSEEQRRNSLGGDVIFVGKHHQLHDFIHELYKSDDKEPTDMPPELCHGIQGKLSLNDNRVLPDEVVHSPIPMLRDLTQNSAISINFKDPQFQDDYIFKSVMLPGAKKPSPVLKPGDWEKTNNDGRPWRPQLGFNRDRRQVHLDQSAFRTLGHSMSRDRGQSGSGVYSNIGPPGTYNQGSSYRPLLSRPQQIPKLLATVVIGPLDYQTSVRVWPTFKRSYLGRGALFNPGRSSHQRREMMTRLPEKDPAQITRVQMIPILTNRSDQVTMGPVEGVTGRSREIPVPPLLPTAEENRYSRRPRFSLQPRHKRTSRRCLEGNQHPFGQRDLCREDSPSRFRECLHRASRNRTSRNRTRSNLYHSCRQLHDNPLYNSAHSIRGDFQPVNPFGKERRLASEWSTRLAKARKEYGMVYLGKEMGRVLPMWLRLSEGERLLFALVPNSGFLLHSFWHRFPA
ncbi:5'-3' exoribonuclease 2-like [Eublepharis macularius]|uniref:5'-3' exoribonuclease 2 n=1 Tax=Eublepharis macularius TaxID=481883 RepID=A0AA97LLP0_EUBMA|nr:5'-3' exoribonuclease 2-like [Eublepharis macularius]